MAFKIVLPATAFVGSGGAILEPTPTPTMLAFPDSGSPLGTSVAFEIPSTYSGGTITVAILNAAAAATTGNFGFTSTFRRLIATDEIDDAFATAQTATEARGATADALEKTDITHTSSQIDGAVAGDQVQLRIGRDNAVGTNASGAAWVAYVIVSEA